MNTLVLILKEFITAKFEVCFLVFSNKVKGCVVKMEITSIRVCCFVTYLVCY